MNTLVNASLYGGAFVLAVGLLCLMARRLPAWVRSWLWGIACAQLLMRLVLSVPIPVEVPAAGPSTEATVDVTVKNYIVGASVKATPKSDRSSPSLVLVLWGVGVAAGLVVATYRWQGARRLVAAAVPVSDPALLRSFAELTRGWSRKPRLLESSRVKCPLLVGCVRPAVVVPIAYAQSHDTAEIRMAFAHELAHIRRGDPWMSLMVAATQTVFFFHPLAWWAGRESALAREEACDVEVLRLSEESPSAYAHFLLKSAQARPPVAGLGAAYGYRNLRRRITMLKGLTNASFSSPRRTWLGLIAAGFAASLPWTVVGQSAPAAPAAPPKSPPVQRHVKPSKTSSPAKKAPPKKVVRPAKVKASAAAAVPNAPPIRPSEDAKEAVYWRSPSRDRLTLLSELPIIAEEVHEGGNVLEVKFGPGIDGPLQRNITARFVGADIRASLLKILNDSGISFVIKAKIRPGTLTGKFNNMTMVDALDAIFQGIDQPLAWRMDGTVLYVVDAPIPGGGGLGGNSSMTPPMEPVPGDLGGGSVAPNEVGSGSSLRSEALNE